MRTTYSVHLILIHFIIWRELIIYKFFLNSFPHFSAVRRIRLVSFATDRYLFILDPSTDAFSSWDYKASQNWTISERLREHMGVVVVWFQILPSTFFRGNWEWQWKPQSGYQASGSTNGRRAIYNSSPNNFNMSGYNHTLFVVYESK